MENLRNIVFYKLFAALFIILLPFMAVFLFIKKKNK
jgi:hypothetical protein